MGHEDSAHERGARPCWASAVVTRSGVTQEEKGGRGSGFSPMKLASSSTTTALWNMGHIRSSRTRSQFMMSVAQLRVHQTTTATRLFVCLFPLRVSPSCHRSLYSCRRHHQSFSHLRRLQLSSLFLPVMTSLFQDGRHRRRDVTFSKWARPSP